MKKKKFLLRAKDIRPLLQTHMGCIVTDRITVDGQKVGFCYPSGFRLAVLFRGRKRRLSG